eukprot:999970-Prymnesium_polylepis.1
MCQTQTRPRTFRPPRSPDERLRHLWCASPARNYTRLGMRVTAPIRACTDTTARSLTYSRALWSPPKRRTAQRFADAMVVARWQRAA